MISNLAFIHADAKIGKDVTIEPFAYVAGNVVIGDNTWLGPNAEKIARFFPGQLFRVSRRI
jgi:UDP-N-acetylglucosamine acyltransferase